MAASDSLVGASSAVVGAAVKGERRRHREELAADLLDFHPSKVCVVHRLAPGVLPVLLPVRFQRCLQR